MKDKAKTKEQLITELKTMRRRVAELEVSQAKSRQGPETRQPYIERLKAQQELDQAIRSSVRLGDIYHAFDRHAIRLLPYNHTSIILQEEDAMRVAYVAGEMDDTAAFPVGAMIVGKNSSISRVVAHDQAILRHNVSAEALSVEDKQVLDRGIRSCMIVPLRVKGRIIGTWIVGSRQVGTYGPDDLKMAQSLADVLATEIEVVRLYKIVQQEISERNRAESSLWTTARRFQSLIESANDIVVILDAAGFLRYTSPSAMRILEYASEDMIGKNIIAFTHPDDAPRVTEILERVSQQPEGGLLEIDYRIQHRNGSWRNFAATVTNLLGNPSVKGLVVNCQDVTERKQLEAQLYHSQKMEAIGRLAGGVAHDFNNLLTIIMVTSETILYRLKDNDPLKEDVEQISRAGESAARLTRQLLAFSREQVLQPVVLDLNIVVSEMSMMLRRLIDNDISLVTGPDAESGWVKVDPGQMEQVILNLVVNARDAMQPGGTLTIETSNIYLDEHYARQHVDLTPGEYVMLTVSDDGHGMDEATRQRVFEPFFTTKERGQGTGLGLATVHGIVMQSSGHISVYSEPGLGTTVNIYLPQSEADFVDTATAVGRT